MNHDIFISYSSKQKSIADGVCHYLEENGVKCWMAPRDIPVGADYGDMIESAIKASKVVVLVFSKQASKSKWVKGEVNVAFTENKSILPYRVDDTDISGSFRVMLNQMHWIDAFPNYTDKLPNLLESIKEISAIPTAAPSQQEKHKFKRFHWSLIGSVLAVVALALIIFLLRKSTDQPTSTEPLSPMTKKSSSVIEVKNVGDQMVITNGGFKYVLKLVDGGDFMMGSENNDAYIDENPVHRVDVNSFYMGESEVTQAFWMAVMDKSPSYNGGWTEEYGLGSEYPAYRVSWNECKEFLSRLNQMTGKTFRLPAEVEWEFAARGGNLGCGNNYKYAGSNTIDNVAWFDDNSGNKTHPVKGKQANELLLYDMSGNVWEWCEDCYSAYCGDTHSHGATSRYRVLRGGSWHMSARYCRVTNRDSRDPNSGGVNYGFRIAL